MNEGQTPAEKALRYAYRLLAVRDRSEEEIRRRLREKGFAAVDDVLCRLRERRHVDDGAFARRWARHLASDRLQGDRRIRQSLREKGIPSAEAEEALTDVRREISEMEAVREILRKRTKDRADTKRTRAEAARLFRHLVGRGFPPALAGEALGNIEEGSFDDDGE